MAASASLGSFPCVSEIMPIVVKAGLLSCGAYPVLVRSSSARTHLSIEQQLAHGIPLHRSYGAQARSAMKMQAAFERKPSEQHGHGKRPRDEKKRRHTSALRGLAADGELCGEACCLTAACRGFVALAASYARPERSSEHGIPCVKTSKRRTDVQPECASRSTMAKLTKP